MGVRSKREPDGYTLAGLIFGVFGLAVGAVLMVNAERQIVADVRLADDHATTVTDGTVVTASKNTFSGHAVAYVPRLQREVQLQHVGVLMDGKQVRIRYLLSDPSVATHDNASPTADDIETTQIRTTVSPGSATASLGTVLAQQRTCSTLDVTGPRKSYQSQPANSAGLPIEPVAESA